MMYSNDSINLSQSFSLVCRILLKTFFLFNKLGSKLIFENVKAKIEKA